MVEPTIESVTKYHDKRGWFCPLWERRTYVVVLNHSFSKKNVFRGFHSQLSPQSKWVRCLSGKIYDYVFNPFTEVLSSFLLEDPTQIVKVPRYCLHAFHALEDSHVEYACDRPYTPERQIVYNMRLIKEVKFQAEDQFILSDKDLASTHTLQQIRALLEPFREIYD